MRSILPEIHTARLVIADAAGAPRIVLGLDEQSEPSIRILDSEGKVRVRLGLERDVDEEPEYCGLMAELRLMGGDDGGEASLTASYDNYAAFEISATRHGSDEEAAGAWVEAKKGRIEANLHDRPGGDGWSFSAGNIRPRLAESAGDGQ
ncbi:MAG: hypothetical protein KGR26_15250 [Cyanobacteria bacterium REEB65]|nr:hypothetical protein [Cyanobacteria bacterium REEB65]